MGADVWQEGILASVRAILRQAIKAVPSRNG